jgi:hypothetical protein
VIKILYTIYFSGAADIEADSPEEAKYIFWEKIDTDEPLPSNLYQIDNVIWEELD